MFRLTDIVKRRLSSHTRHIDSTTLGKDFSRKTNTLSCTSKTIKELHYFVIIENTIYSCLCCISVLKRQHKNKLKHTIVVL